MFTKYVKYLNTRIRNMKGLIMSIEPSGPGDKFLICLLKEVKEESCRHVLEDDPLQNNCKNLQKIQKIPWIPYNPKPKKPSMQIWYEIDGSMTRNRHILNKSTI